MAQSTVLDILTITVATRIVGGSSKRPRTRGRTEFSSTSQNLISKIAMTVIVWKFSTEWVPTLLVCQKVLEIVSLHRFILQADTSTCNLSLIRISLVKGLWLTTDHSTVHQVGLHMLYCRL